ncbi:MAG: sulfate adenylyltransferase subunit 2 [Spirochaetales bacterium]|nr:sulfate adenylyltransferase subunit 2 [Spirochaetales bacterium]
MSGCDHLSQLESEALYVLRETFAQFEKPVLLFSGGKDSVVLAHLAKKAFHPAPIPFSFLHVDTGHNFPETLCFRDEFLGVLGAKLIVRQVQDSLDAGTAHEEEGPNPSRNGLQAITLLEALAEMGFDAALGGARRDEEKSRAKERFFSHRDQYGQWTPKYQRPELWNLFNGMKNKGEHFRIFPLSNWTEMDVWNYIAQEQLSLPSLYFAHERPMVERQGMLLALGEHNTLEPGERSQVLSVRFRTVGDMTCSGGMLSTSQSVFEVISELSNSRKSERGGRADDKRGISAMEDRKRGGYF